MTVKELIEELKKYPEDMIVAGSYECGRYKNTKEIWSTVELSICHWEPTNYPYDREEFDYLNIN